MDTGAAAGGTSEAAAAAANGAPAADAAGSDPAAAADGKGEAMNTEEAAPAPPKVDAAPPTEPAKETGEKKFKTKLVKTEVPVIASCLGVMSDQRLMGAMQVEKEMMQLDISIKELMFARDQLEGFSYNLRDSLEDSLSKFVSAEVKKELLGQCEKLTYWMEDEDFDNPYKKEDYVSRYNKLKKQSDPLWRRKKQFDGRREAVKTLKAKIVSYMSKIKDPSLDHVEKEKRSSVYKKCEEMDGWLIEMDIKQDKIPTHEDPILTLELLETKSRELSHFCDPILNTPKPAPEKPAEDKSADAKAQNGSPDAPPAPDA